MAEYIERDSLAGELERIYEWHYEGCNHKAIHDVFRAVLRRVRSAPTVDAVPVVHGRWEEADDGDGVVCSVCREDFCTIYLEAERFNYCPSCGAHMKEDGNDA